MSAHTDAKNLVQKYLLGTTFSEISRKVPWGFYKDFQLTNYSVDDFLFRPYDFVHTRILHILGGEGEPIERVKTVLIKALAESVRVLILEHNPAAQDWVSNSEVSSEKLNILETCLNDGHYIFQKHFVNDDQNGRNLLYVVSTVPFLDMTNDDLIGKLDFAFVSRKQGASARDPSGRIFVMSSEDVRNPNRLFNEEIVAAVNSSQEPAYFIIGGLMFLDALAQVNPAKIRLFDWCYNQCIYAAFVINAILKYDNLTAFHSKFLLSGGMAQDERDKIAFLWGSYDEFKRTLMESPRHSPQRGVYEDGTPKYKWRNLLYLGVWRKSYEKVRKRLKKHLENIFCSSINELAPPSGSCVYVSTIDIEHFDHLQDHILIYSHNPRNTPCLEDRHNNQKLVYIEKEAET